MKRLLIVVVSATVLIAAGAFAGEVKGPPGSPDTQSTNRTGAPEHANSVCAYSGLNDYDQQEGQRASQVQTPADAFKFYSTAFGFLITNAGVVGRPEFADTGLTCRGGSNPERGGTDED